MTRANDPSPPGAFGRLSGLDARILAISGLSGPIFDMPGSWAIFPLLFLIMLAAVYLGLHNGRHQ